MRKLYPPKTHSVPHSVGFNCVLFGVEAARGLDGVCAGCLALVPAWLSNQSRPPASSKAAADDRTVCTLTTPSLNLGAAWIITGFGNDLVWTPGLFVKASFALIKVDPVPERRLASPCRRLLPPPGSKPGDDVMWVHGWAALFRLFL